MNFVFNEKKSAQAAGYLLRLSGGQMQYLKLMKLLYLSDRAALLESGLPITGGKMISMDKGPVLSQVLNCIRGGGHEWSQAILTGPEFTVRIAKEIGTDELSDYEQDVLDGSYSQFGELTEWELVDLTHELPEWSDPHGSMKPIDVATIFRAAGRTESEIEDVTRQVDSLRRFREAFA